MMLKLGRWTVSVIASEGSALAFVYPQPHRMVSVGLMARSWRVGRSNSWGVRAVSLGPFVVAVTDIKKGYSGEWR